MLLLSGEYNNNNECMAVSVSACLLLSLLLFYGWRAIIKEVGPVRAISVFFCHTVDVSR